MRTLLLLTCVTPHLLSAMRHVDLQCCVIGMKLGSDLETVFAIVEHAVKHRHRFLGF
jgi:hypothetical protein